MLHLVASGGKSSSSTLKSPLLNVVDFDPNVKEEYNKSTLDNKNTMRRTSHVTKSCTSTVQLAARSVSIHSNFY